MSRGFLSGVNGWMYRLTEMFLRAYPEANRGVTLAAALLHDVDDYKLVGREQATRQNNALRIMTNVGMLERDQEVIKDTIASMGFSKSLKGIRPHTLEGMIVSDADMCDAMGASGIIRCLTYALSDKGSGVVFDRNVQLTHEITASIYNAGGTTHHSDSFINYGEVS